MGNCFGSLCILERKEVRMRRPNRYHSFRRRKFWNAKRSGYAEDCHVPMAVRRGMRRDRTGRGMDAETLTAPAVPARPSCQAARRTLREARAMGHSGGKTFTATRRPEKAGDRTFTTSRRPEYGGDRTFSPSCHTEHGGDKTCTASLTRKTAVTILSQPPIAREMAVTKSDPKPPQKSTFPLAKPPSAGAECCHDRH